METKVSKENKYRRFTRGLARFLRKLRDFYVKSMTDWARQMEFGFGPPVVNGSTLTMSFLSSRTLSSSEQDHADLVRIAYKRDLAEKTRTEFLSQRRSTHSGVSIDALHRPSLGMGKIDEDKACDFVGIEGFDLNPIKYPRSKSHVVSRSNGVF